MTLRSHFFLFLLLFSFLQPWRLAASTPDAEDFFKHVTEEGVRLVDEVIEEEDSVSHQPLLNIEQTTVQTDIHSITPSVECAPISHEGSSNSASSISSLFPSSTSNLPSSTAVAIPPAFSLQPLASIQPIDRIVTTGGLKSTGDSSDEEGSDRENTDPDLESQYIQKEKTSQEQAKAAAQAEAQRIIEEKRGEVEAAFARARAAKSESEWNTAKAAAMTASNYWNGVVEAIQTGRSSLPLSQEEATFQRDYWIEKAGVAEVKALGATPCRDSWVDRDDRADAMMTMIKDKVWPIVSQAMKTFIEHPSEARMLYVRKSASASTSAYTSAYAYTSSYAYATAYAAATAAASASASAFAHASAYTSASAYAYAYASAPASEYAYGSAYAYAHASTYAAASAYAYAYEAMEAASVADDVADDTEVCVEIAKRKFCFSNNQQLTLNWSVRAARETADFARAVTKYKEASYRKQVTGNREEENHTAVATTRPMIEPEWKIRVEAVFAKAKIDKSENSWRAAGVEAKKASTICQNAQGMSHRETMEATRQTEYWTEKANISEVKSLATTQCADDWDAQVERANAIMRMIREKFGSPISNAMREFIVHPSEATLRATGKSFVIAMTAAEAEDALESAEVFAKISTDAVALAKREDWDASAQENINFSASVTSEIAEFARAVAAFKKLQEANASSERSFKF